MRKRVTAKSFRLLSTPRKNERSDLHENLPELCILGQSSLH